MQISVEYELQITFTHMQPFNCHSNWFRFCTYSEFVNNCDALNLMLAHHAQLLKNEIYPWNSDQASENDHCVNHCNFRTKHSKTSDQTSILRATLDKFQIRNPELKSRARGIDHREFRPKHQFGLAGRACCRCHRWEAILAKEDDLTI